MRAIVYIDGFNLYYGLLRHSRRQADRDLSAFVAHKRLINRQNHK